MHLIKLEISHWTLNVWCDFFMVKVRRAIKMITDAFDNSEILFGPKDSQKSYIEVRILLC